jgi:hypothetical protein
VTAPTVESVKAVSTRLLYCLLILIGALAALFVVLTAIGRFATLPVVLIFGALGAFLSLQRSLKGLSEEDLRLIKESLTYTWLAPVAGAVLAGILYLLFIAQLLVGPLFPIIDADTATVKAASGMAKLFEVDSKGPGDYAKLFFWSFVAGYSERFVTDIVGKFETKVGKSGG